MPLSVLIADDHFPVRFGLEILTREVLGHNILIDFAKDYPEILHKIGHRKYDLLISDVLMPGGDCLTMLSKASKVLPKLKVLFVSVNPKEIFAARYKKAGAFGYVCKSDSDEELKKAIRHIYLGKRYFPEIISPQQSSPQEVNTEKSIFDLLSKREFTVMLLLLEGKEIVEIAHMLDLSPSTASTYRGRIFEKLKIKTLMDLANLARQYQILIDN